MMSRARARAIALAVSLTMPTLTVAYAAPAVPGFTAGDSGILLITKKKHRNKSPKVWHKTSRGEGRLEGRVAEIDRREAGKAGSRRSKPIGRAPGRNRNGDAEAFNAFMLGMAGAALGAAVGGYGRSGGCGVDVTTANPTSCGGRIGNSGGSNGLRPPYQCIVNGRTITTNTFRSGCWMVRQNNLAIPMGR